MSESYLDSDSSCCSTRSDAAASAELKLYRAFIFSVPIFFTLILLFLFYVFYLRPRRLDWASLRMRSSLSVSQDDSDSDNGNGISTSGACLGLKKEFREMLPIIVYKESFSVNDTQCSVCLLDYQAEDRLQQIPACGHTFHMSCIDLWLSSHSTCPLCRLSLLTTAKSSTQTISNVQSNEETQRLQSNEETQRSQSNEETQRLQSNEETQISQSNAEETQRLQSNEETQTVEYSDPRHLETTVLQNASGQIEIGAHCIDVEGQNAQHNQLEHEYMTDSSGSNDNPVPSN